MGGSTATPFGDGAPIPDPLAQFLSRVMPSIAEPADGYVNVHAFAGTRATYHGGGRAFAGMAEYGLIQSHVGWLNLNESEVFFCLSTQVHSGTTDDRGNRKVGKGSRSRTNARWLKAFVLDLDTKAGGYPSQRSILAALLPFCERIGVDPLLVDSGRGIHGYVILSESVTPPVWQATADRLIAEAQAAGLKFDVGVTRNCATLLRLPTSFNRKTRDNPLMCRVLSWGNDTTLHHLSMVLKAVPVRASAGRTSPAGFDPSLFPSRPPINGSEAAQVRADLERARVVTSVDLLRAACPVVADSDERQGDGDLEPLWFELAKLCHYVEDGRDYFHDLSSDDPRYDPDATDRKYDTVQPQGWPACATIAASSPAAARICDACRHRDEGKSPIHFARGEKLNGINGHAHSFAAQSPIFTALPKVIGFEQLPDGRFITDEGKPTFGNPIYKFELISYVDGAGGFNEHVAIAIPSGLSTGEISSFEVPCSVFASPQRMGELADKGMVSIDNSTARKLALSLIEQMRANRAAYKSARNGWVHAEGKIIGFSYGNKLFTKDGPQASPSRGDERYLPSGNLDSWKQAANLYAGKGLVEMELVFATAFAAPLMYFTAVDGAMVFIRSPNTGVGKTASLEIANSVWAHRDAVIRSTTANALMDELARVNNLPVIHDEMIPDVRHSALILTISAGKEKDRMTRMLKRAPTRKSRTLLVAAANASMVQTVSVNDTNAQAARVFEIEMSDAIRRSGIPDRDRLKAKQAIEMHHGVAGLVYSEFLGRHPDTVAAMISDTIDQFSRVLKLTEDDRYWVAVAATIFVGATIAKKLDLIAFDTVAMHKLLLELLRRQKTSMKDVIADVTDPDVWADKLADFLNENLHSTIHTHRKPTAGKKNPEPVIGGGVDFTNVREYVARIAAEDKWMAVSAPKLKEWCIRRKLNHNTMRVVLINSGRCVQSTNRKELTAQTTLPKKSLKEYLLEFDLSLPANERFLPQ